MSATQPARCQHLASLLVLTPARARSGAAQAAFIAAILYTLVTQLDGYFAAQALPSNYTARNITTAVRTIVAVRNTPLEQSMARSDGRCDHADGES